MAPVPAWPTGHLSLVGLLDQDRNKDGRSKKDYHNQHLLLIRREISKKDSGHGIITAWHEYNGRSLHFSECLLYMDSDPDEDQQMTPPSRTRKEV